MLSVRGKKFLIPTLRLPSGKIVKKKAKGISVDEFASVAGVFTKNKLSLIIGKSLTKKKDRANFIGFIRGEKGPNSISTINRVQLRSALSKVIGATSSAVTRAERAGAKGTKKIAVAANLLKVVKVTRVAPITKTITSKPISPQIINSVNIQVKSQTKIIQSGNKRIQDLNIKLEKSRSRVDSISSQIQKNKNKQSQKFKTKQKVKQLQKLKFKQQSKQRQLTSKLLKQKVKQRLRISQRQKQIQKLKVGGKLTITKLKLKKVIPTVSKKKLPKLKRPKRKPKKAYNAFARPTKKRGRKRKPKLIRVNRVPLTRSRARDVSAFVVDQSLSRRGKIKRTKGIPRKSKLKVPKGYASRTANKYRKFRIVKGKRKPIINSIIEKRTKLLDTKSERRGITLRRKIRQISPRPKKRSKKKVRRTKKRRKK